MPRGGLSMRSVREILRLRLDLKLSSREVAKSCGISRKTVGAYEKRILEGGLSWDDIRDMDDEALRGLVRSNPDKSEPERPLPSPDYITKELKRRHVTRMTLWLEYKAQYPDGYEYSQFCWHISKLLIDPELSMHIEYKAGERLFTDYAGDTMPITDPRTGEITPAYIFVSCLGASNYIYIESTENMQAANWIGSHIRALEFYGGSPEVIVPDNTKTAIRTPDRYEPDINPSLDPAWLLIAWFDKPPVLTHNVFTGLACIFACHDMKGPKTKAFVERKNISDVERLLDSGCRIPVLSWSGGNRRKRSSSTIHQHSSAVRQGAGFCC